MLSRYFLFVRNDLRESHITFFYVLSYFVTTAMTLSVYWFTSKAFAGEVETQIQQFNLRYFDFIVIGEITFLLPTLFYSRPLEVIKHWLNNNTFETLLMTGRNPISEIVTQVCATLPSQLCFGAIYLAMAHFFFQWEVELLNFMGFLALNLLYYPLFFFMGLLMTSIFIITGRGSNIMGQMIAFVAIFSGAYFPLYVLPAAVSNALLYFPFEALMKNSRYLLASQWSEINGVTFMFSLGLWTFLAAAMAISTFRYSLHCIRKRGSYFPKTRSIL